LQGEVSEKLSLAQPVYVTHLATDRPLYYPGDVVRFRSLTLDRFSLKPPDENLELEFLLRLPGDKVVLLGQGPSQVTTRERDRTPLTGPDGLPLRGLGAGEFRLDT